MSIDERFVGLVEQVNTLHSCIVKYIVVSWADLIYYIVDSMHVYVFITLHIYTLNNLHLSVVDVCS